MMLRRVTEHVKAQNWTAVALDFFIVVVGVFIGIQVANWNAARAFKAQENAYLAQLRTELTGNIQMIEYQQRYVEQVVASGRRTLSYVEGDESCKDSCETALIDAFHASQVWGTGYGKSKFEAMNRLGLPTDENVRVKVAEFFSYVNGWDVVNMTPPKYRERVRSVFSPDEAAALWRGCYNITHGTFEELTYDCANDLKSLGTEQTLQRIRADGEISAMLRFWVGQNEYALRYYPEMLGKAEAAIQAIDQALENS